MVREEIKECLGSTTMAATVAAADATVISLLYMKDLSENYWSNQNLRFKWALNIVYIHNKIDIHTVVLCDCESITCSSSKYVCKMWACMCLFVCIRLILSAFLCVFFPRFLFILISVRCYSARFGIACIFTISLNMQSLTPHVVIQSGIWCFDFFCPFLCAVCRIFHFFIICHLFVCVSTLFCAHPFLVFAGCGDSTYINHITHTHKCYCHTTCKFFRSFFVALQNKIKYNNLLHIYYTIKVQIMIASNKTQKINYSFWHFPNFIWNLTNFCVGYHLCAAICSTLKDIK